MKSKLVANQLKLENILFCNNVNDACKNVDLVIIHTEWEEFKALDFKKLYKKKIYVSFP